MLLHKLEISNFVTFLKISSFSTNVHRNIDLNAWEIKLLQENIFKQLFTLF